MSNPLGSTNPPSKKKKHDINTIKFCGCQIRILLLKILSFVSFFFLFFFIFFIRARWFFYMVLRRENDTFLPISLGTEFHGSRTK